MADVKVGQTVIGSDGTSKVVTGIYPKGNRDVFTVTTKQGLEAHSCEEHPWFTQTYEEHKRGKPGKVRSLKEIRATLTRTITKAGRTVEVLNHYLPRVKPVEFDGQPVLVDPYTLGALLGDGSLTSTVVLICPDKEVVERVAASLKGNLRIATSGIVNRVVRKDFSTKNNQLKDDLTTLGLIGSNFQTKFIPKEYLYNSFDVRLALLQGLMDTDGSIKQNGESFFHTSNSGLAQQVSELVRSLGGKAVIRVRDRRGNPRGQTIITKNLTYDVSIVLNFNPFSLKRKAERYKVQNLHADKIKTITYHSHEATQCISIDSEDHLYVTNNFLLTHNTIHDKLEPWLAPMVSVFKERAGASAYDYWKRTGRLELLPLETIRGRSFEDSVVLVDEAQSLTLEEIKSIVTRVGEGSKLILTGDLTQSDITSPGLHYLLKIIERDQLPIPFVLFEAEDVVRSDIVGQLVRSFMKDTEDLYAKYRPFAAK